MKTRQVLTADHTRQIMRRRTIVAVASLWVIAWVFVRLSSNEGFTVLTATEDGVGVGAAAAGLAAATKSAVPRTTTAEKQFSPTSQATTVRATEVPTVAISPLPMQTARETSTAPPSATQTQPQEPTLGPMLPDDFEASRAATAHADSLLARLVGADGSPRGDVPRVRFDRIRAEIAKVHSNFVTSTIKLENSTEPNFALRPDLREIRVGLSLPDLAASTEPSKDGSPPPIWPNMKDTTRLPDDSILYIVQTGNRSHARRVKGIARTLGQLRRVVWYSDAHDAVIDPIVLSSRFEDDVCSREGLVDETQLKGCRYQRGFYRSLMQLADVAHRLGLSSRATNFSGRGFGERGINVSAVRWVVRLADDTMVVPHHLEQHLFSIASGEAATRRAIVVGRNESRESYWFFSGGHPVAFSRGAIERAAAEVLHQCEGFVIDFGGKKFEKFWWWADDVLLSFCFFHLSSRSEPARFELRSLPGCFSEPHFGKFQFPLRLWEPVNNSVRVALASPSLLAASGNRKSKPASRVRLVNVVKAEVPVSYHTYPYITAYQMFGLYNRLYVDGPPRPPLQRL